MTAANIGAEMINGLVRGYMMRKDLDKSASDQAFQEEQRTQQRADWNRANQERTQLSAASAPVTVEEGANGAIKPDTMDNSDVGQPGEAPIPQNGGFAVQGKTFADRASADAAAAAANSPDAIAARQAAAYRSIGKPMEAAQLESAQTQAAAAKFTLNKEQKALVDREFDKRLASITNPDDLAGVLSGSPVAGGRNVTSAASADGKTVDLIAHNPDGSTVKLNNAPIDNTSDGITKAIASYSQSMTPSEKIAANIHFDTLAETKRHNTTDEQHADATLAEQTRHSVVSEGQGQQQIGISRAQLGVAQGHLSVSQQQLQLQRDKMENDKKNDPEYALPGATKLQVKGLDKAIEMRESAILKAMADPMADPNSKGISDIRVQIARLQEQRDKAIKPYLPDSAAPATATGKPADPYGLRASLAAKAPAPAPAPVQPRAAAGLGAAAVAPAAPTQTVGAAGGFQEDPAKTAAVENEMQRAGAERRPMQIPPELQGYAAQLIAARQQQQQQAIQQAAAARAVEQQRQQAEQEAMRARYRTIAR